MQRSEVLRRIDAIRDGLTVSDIDNRVLVGIIRDLEDGYDLEYAKGAVQHLLLSDYTAEQEIKNLITNVTED